MGDGVALHAAAVSHGSLTVSLTKPATSASRMPLRAGARRYAAEQYRGESCAPGRGEFAGSSSLKTLVNALNSLGATPDELCRFYRRCMKRAHWMLTWRYLMKVNASGGIDGSDALMGPRFRPMISSRPRSSLRRFFYAHAERDA